jgi:hypothetical protein
VLAAEICGACVGRTSVFGVFWFSFLFSIAIDIERSLLWFCLV